MTSSQGGYSLELTGAGILYQYDTDGVLPALPAAEIDVSRPFFSAPGNTDSDHDQGDEPPCLDHLCEGVQVCPRCGGPAACAYDLCDECEPAGEWVDLGLVDLAQIEVSGAAALRAEETIRRAARKRPIGPPVPVQSVEHRADGVYVTASLPADHPAYAELHEGLTGHLSIPLPPGQDSPDKSDSVKSRSGSGRPPAVTDGVPLPSATVSGLGPAEIARRRHVPPPQAIGLGDVVAGLFGARLTGDPDEPVAEVVTPVPNRADRRRAARSRRRG